MNRGRYHPVGLKARYQHRAGWWQISLVLMLLVIVGLAILAIFHNANPPVFISPIASANNLTKSMPQINLGQLLEDNFNFNDEALSKIVTQDLNNQPGDYAVVIEGLNANSTQKFFYNDHKVMPAASLYKLFLITATYRAMDNGTINKNDIISVPESHLIDVLGSKEFGYDDTDGGNITYSVSDLLARIATVSDNYAAVMLAEKLGWDKVQAEAEAIGTENTTIKAPISTTASDIALYFRDLYQGQIISPADSEQIIDLLATDQINDRIPAQLPDSLKIAHKTGELDGVRHDAGIVYLAGNPYLIVLMSQNVPYEDDDVQLLAKISGDVYNYFSSAESR